MCPALHQVKGNCAATLCSYWSYGADVNNCLRSVFKIDETPTFIQKDSLCFPSVLHYAITHTSSTVCIFHLLKKGVTSTCCVMHIPLYGNHSWSLGVFPEMMRLCRICYSPHFLSDSKPQLLLHLRRNWKAKTAKFQTALSVCALHV